MKKKSVPKRKKQRNISKKADAGIGKSVAPKIRMIENTVGTARSLEQAGDLIGAVGIYDEFLKSNPRDIGALRNLAVLKFKLDCYSEAASLLMTANDLQPSDPAILYALARSLRLAGRFEDAEKFIRQSIVLTPERADAYYELGLILSNLGWAEEARDAFVNCLIVDPSYKKARWATARVLPRVYQTTDEMVFWRGRAADAITALAAGFSPQAANDVLPAIDTLFLMAYHERDDRPIQEIYGSLVSRVMYAAYGELVLAAERIAAPLRKRDRIRIGYASEHLCTSHTIALLFSGWVLQASRDQFKIHTYHLGQKKDRNSALLAANSDVFRHLKGSISSKIKAIRNDDLDILVYPDVGMGAAAFKLASLRLAPVQCVSWGHPVTTGFPTIDFFLSSDLMEPAGSDTHYSEELIRLPNLSIYYNPGRVNAEPQREKIGRDHFDIPASAVAYLCSQAPQKYLPKYDEIFSRLADRVPNCKFVFIRNGVATAANDRFRDRLCGVFQRNGQNPDDYLHFLPWQPWSAYLALNEVCDVFLDTIGWSGGNTTLEALAHGLPVVTLPGAFMRGRHSYAILKRIGAESCIADSLDGYVEIAARLALDNDFRRRQIEIIRNGSIYLYQDRSAIDGLEAFYRSLFVEPGT